MKWYVTRVSIDDGNEFEFGYSIFDSLQDAIDKVKELSQSPYVGNLFRIYQLSSPLTVRYLDNKIFID